MPEKHTPPTYLPIPKNEKIIPEPNLFVPYTKPNLETLEGSVLLAKVFCELRSFLNDIIATRKASNITIEPFRLPISQHERLNYGKQMALNALHTMQTNEIFRQMCQQLVHRFSLEPNWEVSIQICVLTHHLPVPPNDMGVFITANKNALTFNPDNILASLPTLNSDKVSLTFTQNVGKKRTLDWIKMNWWQLAPLLKPLPKVKPIVRPSKMNPQRLFIGKLAWYLHSDGYGWKEIEKKMDELKIFTDLDYDDNSIRKAYEQWVKLMAKVDGIGKK